MIMLKLPATPENCIACSHQGARIVDENGATVGFRIGEFAYVLDLESAELDESADSRPMRMH